MFSAFLALVAHVKKWAWARLRTT